MHRYIAYMENWVLSYSLVIIIIIIIIIIIYAFVERYYSFKMF